MIDQGADMRRLAQAFGIEYPDAARLDRHVEAVARSWIAVASMVLVE